MAQEMGLKNFFLPAGKKQKGRAWSRMTRPVLFTFAFYGAFDVFVVITRESLPLELLA